MARNKPHKSTVPHRPKLRKDPGVLKLPDLKFRNAEKQKLRLPPPLCTDPDATMASKPALSSLALLASNQASTHGTSSSPTQKTKEQMRRHYVRARSRGVSESVGRGGAAVGR
ncbi:hypothetical protein OG21DRAFT_1516169 [Imleria badia]|nr:hypothetical protein OG21DRAFT_1516169 [Imleria badia]